MFKLKNEFEYIINSDFIDFNGHLTESGFYHYGMLGNIDIFEKCGLIDLFSKYKCGPVTFETNIKFKKEIFVKENIKVKLNLRKINEKGEWERLIKINNKFKHKLNGKILGTEDFTRLPSSAVKDFTCAYHQSSAIRSAAGAGAAPSSSSFCTTTITSTSSFSSSSSHHLHFQL